jgi:glycine cleavage system H protein
MSNESGDQAINQSSDSDLTFMMGEFEAVFPTDRVYARNHMWAQEVECEKAAGKFRFGFTAYAVRLLQDVYFLDWLLDAPAMLKASQEIGSIESKKAESALFAPGPGQLLTFNDTLMEDPSAINTDKYGAGWLLEMQLTENNFLSPEQYLELLVDVWAKTQRTIKGQLNE